ncbi:conserved membrane hypothetical protein [Desulfamplus magnetovallimortis]|uniref:Uncharacterized protein n=1 Tax=Desulfamplus magnetovallimortis TaxID=1246637 RepID=A0A1W1H6V1_9BACT|nr:hypothetical protein [Desulfamplus magnetovallimortis]SLM28156.1 conserved membrane hypothetical protein [Desulfamplus magnetovallimortis]
MTRSLKLFFATMMITALCFGYAGVYFPLEHYDFERLHIFLFNLCTGGTIILYFTEGKDKLSFRTGMFLVLSLLYALSAFFEIYPVTIIISIALASIVESLRIEKFSIFPWNFFTLKESVSAKFHQASLLCLSIGLVMSSIVIINNEYMHAVVMEKLALNTFFLGFSFPLSLITLSVIFSMIRANGESLTGIISVICFWTINLGVIIFFIFILFEKFYPQLVVTSALFIAVITVFRLYRKLGQKMQQKQFLSSGIGFLIATAISGIVYIFYQMAPDYNPVNTKWLLRIHTFASLYGWNLCGLAVICRFRDFPIRMHSGMVIMVHWLTALILAPLGTLIAPFAPLAIAGYVFIVVTLFFSNVKNRRIGQFIVKY